MPPGVIHWRGLQFRVNTENKPAFDETLYTAGNPLCELAFCPAEPDSSHEHERVDHWTAELWAGDEPFRARGDDPLKTLDSLFDTVAAEFAKGNSQLAERTLDLMDEFDWLSHTRQWLSGVRG